MARNGGVRLMKLKLWTLQHEEAYRKMLETGTLRADSEHLFCGEELRHAYDWMAAEMKNRIGKAPEGVNYPVWAWHQWEGKKKRMDLRKAGYADRGTPMVQIEFEADADSVLLSDFDDWHHVLGHMYVADSEEELNHYYSLSEAEKADLLKESWNKIFELNKHTPGWDSPPEQKSIQAVLWEITPSQIIMVEHFWAK